MTSSPSPSKIAVRAVAVALAAALVWSACDRDRGNVTAPVERSTDRLLTNPGVVGTGVGLTTTTAPTIVLTPSSVSFHALPDPLFGGQQCPPLKEEQTVSVTNGDGGILSGLAVGRITFFAGPSAWLYASLSSSTADPSATLTLSVSTGRVATGTAYGASVPVMSPVASNSPQYVSVGFRCGLR